MLLSDDLSILESLSKVQEITGYLTIQGSLQPHNYSHNTLRPTTQTVENSKYIRNI